MQVTSKPKIRYFDANTTDIGFSAIRVRQQDVLWFEIPVDYSFAVQNPHGSCDLMQKHSNSIFAESSFSLQIICQVSTIAVLHHQKDRVG